MNLSIILIFLFLILAFIAIKLFRPQQKKDGPILLGEDLSRLYGNSDSDLGYMTIDLHDATTIDLALDRDNLKDFKSKNSICYIEAKIEPKNNRYSEYELTIKKDKKIELNLQINKHKLFFKNADVFILNETNHVFTGIEFGIQISDYRVSLEEAYHNYKRFMQELLDLGCQNHFGLANVRYKKEQYYKLLELGEYHCLAPDLMKFEEFQTVIQSRNFMSLSCYFYLGDFIIRIFYNDKYFASLEIFYANSIEYALSYFGNDDLYLDFLTEDEAKLKLTALVHENFLERTKLEEIAKKEGFEIDESYLDPFINFEQFKKWNL